jgi:tetratricopeptide (TPR) repeat protein
MAKLYEAEDACKKAQKSFGEIRDVERGVKTYSRLGQIYLQMGRTIDALSTFCRGLDVSKQANRKDEIVKNMIGIARIHLSDGKIKDAKAYLKDAYHLAEEMALITERDEAKNLLQKIK